MINKLPILINTVLFVLLLSGCKPVSLHMTEYSELTEQTDNNKDSGIAEPDEDTILSILIENNLLDNPNKALFWALVNNQTDIAKWLICKGGADVNAKNNVGETPLHWVATNGHVALSEILIGEDARVNEKTSNGYTPLHRAAANGHTTVAEILIKTGAQVNEQGNYGYTPLHRAAYRGHADVAEVLIKAGANINAKDEYGDTPLHFAAYNGKTEVAELLINACVQVNEKNNDNKTPLKIANEWKRKEFADFLRRYGGRE
jgi:ankyrin repeat protein